MGSVVVFPLKPIAPAPRLSYWERLAVPLISRALGSRNEVSLTQSLASGVDIEAPDLNGETPLMWAAVESWPWGMQKLLEAGACVKARSGEGDTALLILMWHVDEACEVSCDSSKGLSEWVVSQESADEMASCLQMLLDAGADPNSSNHQGETPLIISAGMGNVRTAKRLIASGAHPNRVGVHPRGTDDPPTGCSPLHRAVEEGHVDMVRFLLAQGADAEKKNAYGETPREMAAGNEDDQMVRLFEKRLPLEGSGVVRMRPR